MNTATLWSRKADLLGSVGPACPQPKQADQIVAYLGLEMSDTGFDMRLNSILVHRCQPVSVLKIFSVSDQRIIFVVNAAACLKCGSSEGSMSASCATQKSNPATPHASFQYYPKRCPEYTSDGQQTTSNPQK